MNLDTPAGPVLYLSGVTVTFDGFRALDSLSLLVEPGELRLRLTKGRLRLLTRGRGGLQPCA